MLARGHVPVLGKQDLRPFQRHRNFNQFLNEQRLNYVTVHLECTDESITDICMDAGFESQRTFNRAFRERYRMTPREYRTLYKEKYLREEQT